ncbi:hypothetical protein L873DRAFT_65320 [Choiromyces venosus 120613-1]|uniref:Uncharacterized protein n=1 Tax=Choiromyces venosus 120613-1 TaxID=1336337 RepID=A0A3N4J504_9PEZI|nr:hypothetical protein L873DRAFT_65320 [Choiromyces venosus 120613-1]
MKQIRNFNNPHLSSLLNPCTLEITIFDYKYLWVLVVPLPPHFYFILFHENYGQQHPIFGSRYLKIQFIVVENLSTGYSRFLCFLFSCIAAYISKKKDHIWFKVPGS